MEAQLFSFYLDAGQNFQQIEFKVIDALLIDKFWNIYQKKRNEKVTRQFAKLEHRNKELKEDQLNGHTPMVEFYVRNNLVQIKNWKKKISLWEVLSCYILEAFSWYWTGICKSPEQVFPECGPDQKLENGNKSGYITEVIRLKRLLACMLVFTLITVYRRSWCYIIIG